MPASSLSRVCLASLAFAACAAAPLQSGVEAPWQLLARHGGSLRGVAVVERAVAWATGKDGAIWRTTDGGSSWRNVAPRGSEAWDFRDVEAFGADRALAMVAGTPARVLCTEDGGSSWRTVLADDRAGAFFDGMAFAGDVGVLFGDPLDGAFSVWTTRDAGATWQPTPFAALPAPLPGEAAFAAGGGCVAVSGVGDAATFWVATGGGARARLLRGDASGWRAIDLPLPAGGASRGAFAVAWRGAHGVVVGGDYAAPEVGGMATSDDGGATWTAQRGVAGFLSAATWLDDDTVFACGSHGVLTWRRGGEARYEPGQGFHACTPYGADGALAVGADGRIAVRSALVPLPLRLHGLWRDHMVVPTAATVPIVGVTAPHATVAVDASWGAQAAARADGAGRFRAALATPAAPGGPHTVRVFAGATAVVVADVLAGDVWLASGQSNMEMQLGKRGWSDGIDGHEAAIAAANLPQLRVFTVGKATADQPADEVAGEWQLASPATAADFSAVGYHFARALQQARGRPLGLVVSAWGGTVAEAWTPAAGLADFPEFAPQLQAQQRSAALAPAAARQKFWSAVAAAPGGPWRDVEAPEAWSRSDLAGFDGAVEYVRSIELPAAWQGQDLVVELGPLDDMDATAWDGERLGGLDRDGAWSTPRRYPVPATRTPGTRHELRVRVVDTNGEGGFGGGPELLLLRRQDDPTQALPLAGAWRRRTLAALADLPPWPRQLGPNRPAVLWNGMLAPFVGFPFAGAIWYQGESNRGRAGQYERLFPALVRSWRAAFGPELAFLFVQIAPYGYDGDAGEAAELRQAQAAALTLPRTGMVVTLDCGDAKDIHPRNKQPVGERLALLARVRAYGEAVPCDGPVFAAAARRDETVRLAFRSDDGLVLGDGGGFEVAGADGVFHAAAARIDGDEVVLRAAAVPAPTAVRYAWAAVPAWSLRSRGGLPAAPFRAAVR